ncbi:MAG TPA: hypothetical protein PKD61_33800, partial [Polyangiaceae bacterium]|nr:hypothetical protein [Polyangiaceae bacterium]
MITVATTKPKRTSPPAIHAPSGVFDSADDRSGIPLLPEDTAASVPCVGAIGSTPTDGSVRSGTSAGTVNRGCVESGTP